MLGITLIKDGIHLVEETKEPEAKNNLKNLFSSCFLFLKNFVINNSTN